MGNNRTGEKLGYVWMLLCGSIVAILIAMLLGCNGADGTAPKLLGPSSPREVQDRSNTSSEPLPAPTTPTPEPAPRQARGELVITGNFAQCNQSTNYPIDRLAMYVVQDVGAQGRIRLYNPPEGNIPCGKKLQLDCSVRNPDPDATYSAYNLYASTVLELECRTTTPSCTPAWVEGEVVETFVGECEDRQRRVEIFYHHKCTGEIRSEVIFFPAPEECDDNSSDDCSTPNKGQIRTWVGPGDPQTECRMFGDFNATDQQGADFALCKAGNDREVVGVGFIGATCPGNGKEVSHITYCECADDNNID